MSKSLNDHVFCLRLEINVHSSGMHILQDFDSIIVRKSIMTQDLNG